MNFRITSPIQKQNKAKHSKTPTPTTSSSLLRNLWNVEIAVGRTDLCCWIIFSPLNIRLLNSFQLRYIFFFFVILWPLDRFASWILCSIGLHIVCKKAVNIFTNLIICHFTEFSCFIYIIAGFSWFSWGFLHRCPSHLWLMTILPLLFQFLGFLFCSLM